jgi:hypothetical protein
VKIFFDNCTTPVLATTLNGFVTHRGHSAYHVADLPCGRSAADVEWIDLLGDDRLVWMVVTGDDRIRKNKAERGLPGGRAVRICACTCLPEDPGQSGRLISSLALAGDGAAVWAGQRTGAS